MFSGKKGVYLLKKRFYLMKTEKFKMKKQMAFLIIILFFALVLSSYFGFKKDFFRKPTQGNFSHFQENISQIQSPCRELSLNKGSEKTATASESLQRLTKWMDQPIDLVFKDIKGSVIDLYCFRGKKRILLNFWASWCAPCIQELPSLSELAEKHKEEILVVAVSSESIERIQSFLNQSFSDLSPHLRVVQMDEKHKQKYFPKDQIPVTYLFNKEGLLRFKEVGVRDWAEESLVQQILQLP